MQSAAFAAILLLAAVHTLGAIRTETIEYSDGDLKLLGYVAYDDTLPDKRPGVLVIPEWWGVNDYVKGRARQLAEMGYVAFVADMYGEGKVTTDATEAGELAGEAKQRGLAQRAEALKVLRGHELVDPARLAAIGYCFGGTTVLEMARAGHDLRGVVSFHGDLSTKNPARPDTVKARVLVLHGEADPMVPPDQVKAFEQEMKQANVQAEVVQYEHAVHSFTNPDADKANIPGVSYNADADKKSWQKMKEFFSDLLV